MHKELSRSARPDKNVSAILRAKTMLASEKVRKFVSLGKTLKVLCRTLAERVLVGKILRLLEENPS